MKEIRRKGREEANKGRLGRIQEEKWNRKVF
jgi:hypothetical protein